MTDARAPGPQHIRVFVRGSGPGLGTRVDGSGDGPGAGFFVRDGGKGVATFVLAAPLILMVEGGEP